MSEENLNMLVSVGVLIT